MAGTSESYIGQTTEGEVPNINGSIGFGSTDGTAPVSGAFYNGSSIQGIRGNGSNVKNITFDAKRVSNLYVDGVTKVKAASLYMSYVIKY